jgi:hypothetical protein
MALPESKALKSEAASESLGAQQIAAGNCHRAFSFDGAMKFEHHHCSQRQAPVAVPELWR